MHDDDEVLHEELYCAACRELLRTDGKMADHIWSKTHKMAEEHLRGWLPKAERKLDAL